MNYFMKKYFSFKINKALIDKKSEIIQKEVKNLKRKEKRWKYLFYFMGFSFVSSYLHYLMKASGLMKSLEIDKKYINRQKKIEEKYNLDMEQNDKKLKQFEEKWAINKALEEYENKLKYGNKELNKRDESIEGDAIPYDNLDADKEISLYSNKDNKSVEEVSSFHENNLEIVKGKDYEQLKYFQGAEENFDPTKIGNTIIFDSRLDRVKSVTKK